MQKYYWLKLHRDFMKRHDIRILKAMPNGKDYVLFYMTLLLESIDHQGELRFNELIPYDEAMLSTVTDTNVDVVRSAIKILKSMNLIEIWDDGTIYINETKKMLGENSTERVRRFREKQKVKEIGNVSRNVTETENVTDIDIEIELELDKELKPNVQFEQFWKAYPKKIGKDKCFRWFNQNKVDHKLLQSMIQAIQTQKKTQQWIKENGQFIPHPYTWLNQGRWQDEVEQSRWDMIEGDF
jgi:predicted phage replisome organizer